MGKYARRNEMEAESFARFEKSKKRDTVVKM
jgi:hypothetical protein